MKRRSIEKIQLNKTALSFVRAPKVNLDDPIMSSCVPHVREFLKTADYVSDYFSDFLLFAVVRVCRLNVM